MTNMEIKKSIILFFLCIEIIIFSFTYLFGDNSLLYVLNLKNENQKTKGEVEIIKNDIDELEKKIKNWNDGDFYKEKFAREQLQLSKNNEQIYYIA